MSKAKSQSPGRILTPFPVFEFHPDDPGEYPFKAADFGAQPRDFKGMGVVNQFCYRCGTQTGLHSTNCHNDDFEFCETCDGFTLHYITRK